MWEIIDYWRNNHSMEIVETFKILDFWSSNKKERKEIYK